MTRPKPFVLCILDGFGISPDWDANAVAQANMPFWRALLQNYPNTQLDTSGHAVGLPAGEMGNSEVGHITIGSGRVVDQFLRRFERARACGEVDASPALAGLAKTPGLVHIIGCMSDGNTHASLNDTIYIMNQLIERGCKLCVHFISDGRDTPAKSAQTFVDRLLTEFGGKNVQFGTLVGRYYAMDRAGYLDRTKLAADAIDRGNDTKAVSLSDALAGAYARGETDEFIKPITIGNYAGIDHKNDAVFIVNYRSDRMRQLVVMLHDAGIKNLFTMASMGDPLDGYIVPILPAIKTTETLGDIVEKAGLRQLRAAESEKFNHITYFFDSERKIDYTGEEKINIPSPQVKTFDLMPEMCAGQLTDAVMERLDKFDFIVMNYANGDSVGHMAKLQPTIQALEFLDGCLARLVPAVQKLGGGLMIISDHGNAENTNITSHTTNPVPCVFVMDKALPLKSCLGLSSVAPTILEVLGLPQPAAMTGESLIKKE
ncbi:MAG: 2,3-bisphosphoglycerate-independent phosphoglycerate mutase [Rickettsiales bacterium]|jgi:2,3-bisphosphoglycerate-independent phosphoglycerate mutase|nr:2,3-bisphosphoglycerate-independent phosphoglycerate mutase [Rickettsiales bacterium]